MSSSDADPAELEGRRQREADKLEQRSAELRQDVEEVSQDWQQKRASEGVPGAKMPESDENGEEPEGDDEGSASHEDDDSSSDGDDE
jgi:hypothetical protein